MSRVYKKEDDTEFEIPNGYIRAAYIHDGVNKFIDTTNNHIYVWECDNNKFNILQLVKKENEDVWKIGFFIVQTNKYMIRIHVEDMEKYLNQESNKE